MTTMPTRCVPLIRSCRPYSVRELLQALQAGRQVVLWFEHDLYDQLQLLDILAMAAAAGRAPELIVVGSFPGKPSFRGLGELTADQLQTLWPARVAAAPDTLAAAAVRRISDAAPDHVNCSWTSPRGPFRLACVRRRRRGQVPRPL